MHPLKILRREKSEERKSEAYSKPVKRLEWSVPFQAFERILNRSLRTHVFCQNEIFETKSLSFILNYKSWNNAFSP